MSAHTPGPWTLEQNARGGTNFRCSWGVIGCVLSGNSFVPGGPNQASEQRANAVLISFAPEMLEALKDAYPHIENYALRSGIGALIIAATGAA